MSSFKTDALRPSSLPSAQFGQSFSARVDTTGSSLQEDLQKSYEEWNKRIDTEVGSLATGLQDLVDLANVSELQDLLTVPHHPNLIFTCMRLFFPPQTDLLLRDMLIGWKEVGSQQIGESPSPHAHTTTSLNLQLRTSQIIRSTQNLRDIAHDLKLTLLLSDEMELAQRRDYELRAVRGEIEERRKQAGEAVVAILEGDCQGSTSQRHDGPVTSKNRSTGQTVAPAPNRDEANGKRRSEQESTSPQVNMGGVEPPAVAASTLDSDDDEDMEEV